MTTGCVLFDAQCPKVVHFPNSPIHSFDTCIHQKIIFSRDSEYSLLCDKQFLTNFERFFLSASSQFSIFGSLYGYENKQSHRMRSILDLGKDTIHAVLQTVSARAFLVSSLICSIICSFAPGRLISAR